MTENDKEPTPYTETGFVGRSIIFAILVAGIAGWIVAEASWIKIIFIVLFSGVWTVGLSIHQATNIEYGIIFLMGLIIPVGCYVYGHPEFFWPYLLSSFIGSVNGILGRFTRENWKRHQLSIEEAQAQLTEGKETNLHLPG